MWVRVITGVRSKEDLESPVAKKAVDIVSPHASSHAITSFDDLDRDALLR